jgi:hypothetical protein
MSRPWITAAIAASLIAFGISYAFASSDAEAPPATGPVQRLELQKPGPSPSTWRRVRVPGTPAVLAIPSGWRQIGGDPGTASAGLRAGSRIVGYLNATPQGGKETLANWLSFRPDHNREEGDKSLTPLAGARDLPFRAGRGSCLVDGYTTGAGTRYRELACIVAGRHATTVVVGSAVPRRWSTLAPVLRRAVSSFTT